MRSTEPRVGGRCPEPVRSPWRRRLAVLGGALLAVPGAVLVTAAPAAAQTQACTAPPPPSPGALAKNIDTSLGCDATDGAAGNPATGFISLTMPEGSNTIEPDGLYDYFFAVSGGVFEGFGGTYALTFSNCTGGTGSGATYLLESSGGGGGLAPAGPGANMSSTTAGGTVSCAYSVSYAGTPPAGTRVSNGVTAILDPITLVHGESAEVQRFGAAEVPEAPLAIMLPAVGGLAVLGMVLLRRRRRAEPTPAS